MTSRRGRSTSPLRNTRPPPPMDPTAADDTFINPRQLEAFSRTVHATASQLITSNFPQSEPNAHDAYRSALTSVHRSLRRPAIQRSVFSFAKANPRELIRSNFNTSEIEHRALTWLPDELLRNVPESASPFSLFEGFKASLPDDEPERITGRKKRRRGSRGQQQRLLDGPEEETGPSRLVKLRREKDRMAHRLEMMGIRKTMCASEIREIDDKISNLNTMRKVILERLAGLEQEEHDLEQEVGEATERLEELQEAWEDEAALATKSPKALSAVKEGNEDDDVITEEPARGEDDMMGTSFMSESIYSKLPLQDNSTPSPRSSNKSKKHPNRMPNKRTISSAILHSHMDPGSRIRELQAHNDLITALDFDAPFGTMVTAALDDTVRVWDLNAGRCMGLLEGHLSSVRCLQVEERLCATGSMDASIRLWDLGMADYNPALADKYLHSRSAHPEDGETDAEGEELFTPAASEAGEASPQPSQYQPRPDAMADCHLFTLSAHVAEITALHFRGSTLVSGSADKTLRQWDLEKGRCVQTLDVLWAAAQASTINNTSSTSASESGGAAAAGGGVGGGSSNGSRSNAWWRPTTGRLPVAEADFVGALQVFDAALACGTADGMVRLWDLRSGMVHRSLVGHTGPVTALQFDDVYLVTGSRDRSIRIWDLRTGSIHDAYAYDNSVTSMMFDARHIVAAAGEDIVKVYDKADGRHWDCGAGEGEGEGSKPRPAVVERVRIKDGYLVEGRRDGVVGVWSC